MQLRAGLLTFVALTGAAVSACSEDETYQAGRVVRPSGLAYVEWNDGVANPLDGRADVFVADPESGGISVIQLDAYASTNEQGTVIESRVSYLRSPSLFFPLVLPAPEYATQVATASTAVATRLYALSPTDSRLHVFGIGPAAYDSSVTETNPYSVLGVIELASGAQDPQQLAGGILARGLVVDVKVLRDDLVLLAVDDVTGGPARLLSLSISGTGEALTAQVVGSATIAATPRRIAVRSAAPRGVWVSSASTSSVSFVSLLDDGTSDRALGAAILVGVGGPSSAVVDAGASGAVALRIDSPTIVLLESDGGRWARAQRKPFTPYNTGLERPGELRVRSVPITGASGRLPLLPAPNAPIAGGDLLQATDRGADGQGPVVYLTYADGGGAFLVGNPLRWPAESVRNLTLSTGEAGGVRFESCPDVEPLSCEEVSEVPNLSPYVCPGVAALARGGIQVVYRGAFALAPAATIAATSTVGTAEIAVGSGALGLGSARIGDRVFVASTAQTCTSSRAVSGELAILGIAGEQLRVALPEGALAGALASCGGMLDVRAEVFAAGPEFMVATTAGQRVRVPAVVSDGRQTGSSTVGIAADFSVIETATCAVTTVTVRACSSDADCPGATCGTSSDAVCGGRCTAGCEAGDLDCWLGRPERRCPTGEVAVAVETTVGNETDPGFDTRLSTTIFSVPEDVVFSPLHRGWIITFPGARRIAHARVSARGVLLLNELGALE